MNPLAIIGSIAGGVIATLSILLVLCNNTKDGLIQDNSDLEAALKLQNKEIEDQRIDYEKKLKEYETTEPRTVYIPRDVNMTRGNCNDIENLIDGIRGIDF